MEQNKNEQQPEPTVFSYICVAITFVMFIWFISMVVSSFSETTPSKPCEQYNLSRYANSVDDLLITHEATGVITNRYSSGNKYVVEVNFNLYKSTTPEQRSLIRCCAKEKAKQNHLKPLVIDEKGVDY